MLLMLVSSFWYMYWYMCMTHLSSKNIFFAGQLLGISGDQDAQIFHWAPRRRWHPAKTATCCKQDLVSANIFLLSTAQASSPTRRKVFAEAICQSRTAMGSLHDN